MVNKKKLKRTVFLFSFFFLLGIFVVFAYWLLPQTYFQQDEWMTFTEHLYSVNNGGFVDFPFRVFRSTGHAHAIPLSLFRSYAQISFFKLQFEPYAILSIIHHLINTFLVFYLALLLFKSRILSFATALLFGLNSIGSQAVIWMAATINTQGAVSCVLISFIFFFYYVKFKNKKIYFILSLFFVVLGTLFKETAFVGLVSLLFFIFIWGENRMHIMKKIVPFILLIMFFYLILRAPLVLLSNNAFEKKPIKPWEQATIATYAYRGITYPLKIISQSVLPYPVISAISKEIVLIGYPHQFVLSKNEVNPYIRESIVFDLVSYTITLFLIILAYAIGKFSSLDTRYKKTLLSFFVFTGVAAIPYVFLPARPGYFSIFEPRFLYMPAIGIAFLEVVFLYAFVKLLVKKERYLGIFVLLFVIMISSYHALIIRNNIQDLEKTARTRKSVISQTIALFPDLPKKVIFYSESDKEYYGQEEKILPFQSGFGQTLLVWYSFHSENFPGCFFEDNFLYPLEEKGRYKECNKRGFGYFRDYDRMLDVIKNEKFNIENVYAISWNSFEEKIIDISLPTRQKIISDLRAE